MIDVTNKAALAARKWRAVLVAKLLAGAAFFLTLCGGTLLTVSGAAFAQTDSLTDELLRLDLQVAEQGVQVSIYNAGDRPVSLLSWGTPFGDTLDADVFQIRDTFFVASPDFDLEYLGLIFKRGQPRLDDFVTIAAGQAITTSVVLSDYYAVDVASTFRVQYKGALRYTTDIDAVIIAGEGSAGLQHFSPEANSIEVSLEVPPETRAAQVPVFNSCSASQQAELVTAIQGAETITRNAAIALASLDVQQRSSSPRYTRWFGRYSEARYSRVYSGFSTMQSVLENNTIDLVCGCTRANTFAFVNRSRPFEINLCPNFWTASLFGSDSRSGTIVHELSHFNEIIGTSDFEYGPSLVANLAATDPDRAVLNADSYEYFAENQPELPIAGTDTGLGDGVTLLPLDVVQSGSLSESQSAYFSVTGADSVELTSVGGDADLYVYRAVTDQNVYCESVTTGSIDACSVVSLPSAVVRVYAYSDSSFQVVARSVRVTGQGGSSGAGEDGGSISIWLLILGLITSCYRRYARGPRNITLSSPGASN